MTLSDSTSRPGSLLSHGERLELPALLEVVVDRLDLPSALADPLRGERVRRSPSLTCPGRCEAARHGLAPLRALGDRGPNALRVRPHHDEGETGHGLRLRLDDDRRRLRVADRVRVHLAGEVALHLRSAIAEVVALGTPFATARPMGVEVDDRLVVEPRVEGRAREPAATASLPRGHRAVADPFLSGATLTLSDSTLRAAAAIAAKPSRSASVNAATPPCLQTRQCIAWIAYSARGLLAHRRSVRFRRRDPRLLPPRVRHSGAAREADQRLRRGPQRRPLSKDGRARMARRDDPRGPRGLGRRDARRLSVHGGDVAGSGTGRRLCHDPDRRRRHPALRHRRAEARRARRDRRAARSRRSR